MDLKIEYLDINDLKPYGRNAKKHPKEQVQRIVNSIKEFGMCDPIGIWGKDNLIVEGHGRLFALKELGYTEVPVIRLDHLTEEQRKAYTLAHNKTNESEWDIELLLDELNDITDFDMSDFGFELEEESEEPKEVVEDDFDGEVPEEPKSKLGDIYQLGEHRLMCGDSTKVEDVEKLMNGNKADLILTDPPYNVDYEGSSGMKIQNDNMDGESFKTFLTDVFRNVDSVMKEGAAFYIWFADVETYNFTAAVKEVGWKLAQTLIWVKNSLILGRKDYHFKHEPCLYGWKLGASHNWYGDRRQVTTLEFNKPSRNEMHPTMKPLDLIGYQIKNSSKSNDIVLDVFGGSGSTLVACEQLNRKCYTMELDPKYVDVIINRWETLTGKEAVLINGEE